MAALVRTQRGRVEVKLFAFCLQERDEDAVPVLLPENWHAQGGFLTACGGRLDVSSAGHTHTADQAGAHRIVGHALSSPPADVPGRRRSGWPEPAPTGRVPRPPRSGDLSQRLRTAERRDHVQPQE